MVKYTYLYNNKTLYDLIRNESVPAYRRRYEGPSIYTGVAPPELSIQILRKRAFLRTEPSSASYR
jgi:hypothetical protein